MVVTKRGKTPRCKKCDEWVDKSLNDFTKKSNGYYHNECVALLDMQRQHKDDLCEYIKQLYNLPQPTKFMFTQMESFRTEQNYTYKGMEYTLRYIIDIARKDLFDPSTGAGIGIIEYYYLIAGAHYANMESIVESAQGVDIASKKTIVLDRNANKSKPKRMINIGDIV